ncbi:MAG: hypothetical protein HZC54_21295 [Verrucomicrobia bacterium]|nr:hypothetical protein [Verrucomicrobiota bacterium]
MIRYDTRSAPDRNAWAARQLLVARPSSASTQAMSNSRIVPANSRPAAVPAAATP